MAKRIALDQRKQKLCKQHKFDVSSIPLQKYDYGSKYGILMNNNNFNQARQAMPRKFLIYIMCGMNPIMDKSWIEVKNYCMKYNINPLIYNQINDIDKSHNFGTWNPKYFCMENRIIDLENELMRLSR